MIEGHQNLISLHYSFCDAISNANDFCALQYHIASAFIAIPFEAKGLFKCSLYVLLSATPTQPVDGVLIRFLDLTNMVVIQTLIGRAGFVTDHWKACFPQNLMFLLGQTSLRWGFTIQNNAL